MPRELRPELVTLIATGNYGMHTTHDIRLTDGTLVYLSSGEILVNNADKNQQYQGVLDKVQPLMMSVDIEADIQEFEVTNVDKVIGQVLTGAVRQLDGASTIIGAIFIDNYKPFLPENLFWDARIKAQLSTGEVSDPIVNFTATSDIDAISVSGDLISEEFPWQEPVNNAPLSDPNDLGLGGSGGLGDGPRGRYGDLDNLSPIKRISPL